MRKFIFFSLWISLLFSASIWAQPAQPRLIVLADMGNEPDEEQQMMHLLVCSNEIDLKGLISVSSAIIHPKSKMLYRRVVHPELFHGLIDGYESVYENLKKHAQGWQSPDDLRRIVARGQPEYGMGGVGYGKSTQGSELIIKEGVKEDPRPLFIVINAGSNTLAQALYDYRNNHSAEELAAFIAKLRVYENAAQDDAGAWINHEFPEIHWIRSVHQTKCFGGPLTHELGPHNWKPYPYTAKGQDDWAREHVRTGHGPLGELYPIRFYHEFTPSSPNFIEGGGTMPWLMLLRPGHTDPSETSWGSWSGRYTVDKIKNYPARWEMVQEGEDKYRPWYVYGDAEGSWTDPETGITYEDAHAPVWPWRQAMWNDFQARMDWCIQPYEKANHYPEAVLNGDPSDQILKMSVSTGETLTFDASGSSDPDRDQLRYFWWFYPEAGRNPYGKDLPLEKPEAEKISLKIPTDASGKELHLILEVWDRSEIVPLVDYRRVVLFVN